MIRKLSSGGYRLYSRKKDPKTGDGGTWDVQDARAALRTSGVQYFKRAG